MHSQSPSVTHTAPHTPSLTPSLNGSDRAPTAVAPWRNCIAQGLLFRYISCPGHCGDNQEQPLIVGQMAGAMDQCGTSLHRMISLDRRTLESKYRPWAKCHRCLRSSQRTQISTNQLGTCLRVCVVSVRCLHINTYVDSFQSGTWIRYPGRRRGCKCVRRGGRDCSVLCYPVIVMLLWCIF